MATVENLLNDPKFIENLGLVVAQALAFFIVVWILKIFAWKPLTKILDDRQAKIAGEFKKAEDLEKQFQALKAEYEEKNKQFAAEAREKLQEQIQEGKKIAEQMRNEAQEQAKGLIEKGRLHTQIEIEKARKQLQQEVSDMVFTVAAKIMRKNIDQAQNRELVADFIKDAGNYHGQ